METKIVTALAAGEVDEVAGELARRARESFAGEPPSLVLAFASPAQPLGELLPAIRARLGDVPLIAASSAGEFTEEGDRRGSTALFALTGDFRAYAGIGKGLRASTRAAVASALAGAGAPSELPGYPYRTAIVMLDATAGRGEEVTLLTAALLGPMVRMAGGAASGELQATCVGCGAEAASDAVVIAVLFSKKPLGVGVCHGFAPFGERMRVTRAEGNVVKEIEGLPAWEVWKDRTRERAAARGFDVESLTKEQEGTFLLSYEMSLDAGTELKVRAPLSRGEDGSLHFVCGIPEGTVFRIADAEPIEAQMRSAREAARRAREQIYGKPVAGALVFDCVVRSSLLKESFHRAIAGIAEELGGAPLAGFETFGEIALKAGDMSGYHNTTTVVLAFPATP